MNTENQIEAEKLHLGREKINLAYAKAAALKAARRNALKMIPITPRAFDMLDRFYLTCPLAKKELAALAVMELLTKKPSNSELLKMWEKHREHVFA